MSDQPQGTQGDLADVSVGRILEVLEARQATATVTVLSGDCQGEVVVHAGAMHWAEFDGLSGEGALAALRSLRIGTFEVQERLPPLPGATNTEVEIRGTTARVSFVELMRYCETRALTCDVTIIIDFDRVVFSYRAGQLVRSCVNGEDGRAANIVRLRQAKFRITLPPLELEEEDAGPATEPELFLAGTQTRPYPHLFRRERPPLEDPPSGEAQTSDTDLCEFDTTLRRYGVAPPERHPDSGLLPRS